MPRDDSPTARGELAMVERWLIERSHTLAMAPHDRVDPDLDLIDSGLIDSLRLVEFIFLLGEATGTEIDVDELTIDKVRTLGQISKHYF